jgi:glutathione S-transferase
MDLLESFLNNQYFIVGNAMTVADLPIYCELITVLRLLNLNANDYSNVKAWISRMEEN